MSSDSQQPHSNGSNGVDNAVEDAVEGLGLHQLDRQMDWKAKYDELKTKSVAFAKVRRFPQRASHTASLSHAH